TWNYDGGPNGNDWSGNGTTFAADGATISIWHDAGGIWRNNTQAESSVMHGYLDDGTPAQNYIHLTGLGSWLSNVGATEYRVTVLRSTDNATGWDPIEVKTGAVTGEANWLGNGDPTGGTVVSQPNIPGINLGAQTLRTYETPAITLSDNGLALHYLNTGGPGSHPRGSVAGIIIESVPVPEPSSTALLGLGGLTLILRRKK
ncbi:MAG: PEP-CTERM sorting domain-containing protein, partial [Akkermansiaceae bacterium]